MNKFSARISAIQSGVLLKGVLVSSWVTVYLKKVIKGNRGHKKSPLSHLPLSVSTPDRLYTY